MKRSQTTRVGDVFYGNTALEYLGKKRGGYLWQWQCSCGNKFEALTSNVCSGKTRSCGHIAREISKVTIYKAKQVSLAHLREADVSTPANKLKQNVRIRNIYLTQENRYKVSITREGMTFVKVYPTLELALEAKKCVIAAYLNGKKKWYEMLKMEGSSNN